MVMIVPGCWQDRPRLLILTAMKPLLRRRITRHLERAVTKLIKRDPELKIVAVGGSVGKTSTKMAIATVLQQKYRVLVHEGNYNTELGLPLSLFELEAPAKITDIGAWLRLLGAVRQTLHKPYPYDVAVLELGIDHSGDMANFMAYLKPDIGIVTAIGPEHMEHFADLDMVADEEFALDLGSRAVALHSDDAKLAERQAKLGDRLVMTYGESGAVHWAGGDDLCLGGERAETITVKPQVLGNHSRLALLAAATVGVMLELSSEEIRKGIDQVQPVAGRMRSFKGKNGSTIIDDSYNASPDAVLAAIATLHQAKGRKIALLGQMNELGSYSQEAHEMVGKVAAKLDVVLTVGEDANSILGPAAVKAGLGEADLHVFTTPYEAGKWLVKAVKKGDTILVKGSQNGVFAEEAIKPILADPADEAKLVRQSPEWLARKAKQFGVN